ncbi:MAG: leucine-rich repeat domain-containing protein [Porphyromonadaceae bacterium]|nr:MAG: leucine-rich repeat domain-containing protein [Porphyromonadaceae bacterium]
MAFATLISLTSWGITTVESQPGKLESLLTDHSITSLKVTGTIDARDFKFIADNLLALSEIDLSEVTIAAYCNDETATFGADNNFAAASIPCTSFFGKSITSVVLPASVKSIGYAAFAGCEQLTTITFPTSLDSISSYAFSGSGLTSVALPASVKIVGDGAFARCENLASATVGSENIGKDAFYADAALATLTLNKEVKTIGDGAFKSCVALTGINIEGTALESIGNEAFAYTSISALDLSAQKSLKTVGGWALAKNACQHSNPAQQRRHRGRRCFLLCRTTRNHQPARQPHHSSCLHIRWCRGTCGREHRASNGYRNRRLLVLQRLRHAKFHHSKRASTASVQRRWLE